MQASTIELKSLSNSEHFLQRIIRSCVFGALYLRRLKLLLEASLRIVHNDNILPLLEQEPFYTKIQPISDPFLQTLTILHAYKTTPSLDIFCSSEAVCCLLRKSVFL